MIDGAQQAPCGGVSTDGKSKTSNLDEAWLVWSANSDSPAQPAHWTGIRQSFVTRTGIQLFSSTTIPSQVSYRFNAELPAVPVGQHRHSSTTGIELN